MLVEKEPNGSEAANGFRHSNTEAVTCQAKMGKAWAVVAIALLKLGGTCIPSYPYHTMYIIYSGIFFAWALAQFWYSGFIYHQYSLFVFKITQPA